MDFLQALMAHPERAIWIAALAAGVALAALLVTYRMRTAQRGRIRQTLRGLGRPQLHGVLIPDGVGGAIHLDHVVLTRGGVLVLDIRNFKGTLFGGEKMQTWTQMVRSGSYRFINPLPENRSRVQAVKMLVPDLPVIGRVVFTSDGHFPRGVPEGVSMLDDLDRDLAAVIGNGVVPESYLQAWQKLKAAVLSEQELLQIAPGESVVRPGRLR